MSVRRLLEERLDRSWSNLRTSVERAEKDPSTASHVAVEQDLEDLDLYRRIHAALADEARDLDSPYRSDGTSSFFADVAAAVVDKNRRAGSRLAEHRNANEDRSTTSTLAGLVVPQYLVDRVAPKGRSGRPLADLLAEPLPDSGATVTIPRVTTGATTLEQSTENTGTVQTSLATEGITVPVRSLVIAIELSRQIVERATPSEDAVVARELLGASDGSLSSKTEDYLVSTILGTTGASTVTWTDATPTAAELVGKVAAGITTATAQRGGQGPDTLVLHPRRWAWLLSRNESLPGAVVPVPPAGSPPSVVGTVCGLQVVTTGAIPTDEGTGENEDVMVLLRRGDIYYAEAAPTVEVNETATRSASMAVVLMAHQYVAATAELYPSSLVLVGGTGLSATAT